MLPLTTSQSALERLGVYRPPKRVTERNEIMGRSYFLIHLI